MSSSLKTICPSAPIFKAWHLHPTLTALQPCMQVTADCWALLAATDGSSRKEH
jgi:hypothetical protein